MRRSSFAAGLLVALAACAPSGSTATTQGAATPAEPIATPPRGATLGPEGYATILDAPPAPFAPVEPGPRKPPTAEQAAGQEQFARVGAFQRAVRPQAMALDRRLRTAERGNYVNRYFDNDGEPQAVFTFLRDGPGTLAKYTRDPRFRGETVRYTQAELQRIGDDLYARFRNDRVIGGYGTGGADNRVEVDLAVTEAEFRALAARKGYVIPDAVKLRSYAERPAAELNGPLPPEVARLVRIFPRDDRPVGLVNAINSTAKIVLRDGCLRAMVDLDGGREGGQLVDALVLLPLGARLDIDREGYLAFGSDGAGAARVGETVVMPGSLGEVTAPELVEPIRRACGPGPVVRITGLRSAAAQDAQGRVTENANALRSFRESYGLSEAAARTALERCKAATGTGACYQTPPRPVASQADCPAGTKLFHGLCRTPEGYTRPVPAWMADLVGK